jgi:hypothetical protein
MKQRMCAMWGCVRPRTVQSPNTRSVIDWRSSRVISILPISGTILPELYQGVVVLKLHEDATAEQVTKLLIGFAGRDDWLKHLDGRLAIVETWRVRFRPA